MLLLMIMQAVQMLFLRDEVKVWNIQLQLEVDEDEGVLDLDALDDDEELDELYLEILQCIETVLVLLQAWGVHDEINVLNEVTEVILVQQILALLYIRKLIDEVVEEAVEFERMVEAEVVLEEIDMQRVVIPLEGMPFDVHEKWGVLEEHIFEVVAVDAPYDEVVGVLQEVEIQMLFSYMLLVLVIQHLETEEWVQRELDEVKLYVMLDEVVQGNEGQ